MNFIKKAILSLASDAAKENAKYYTSAVIVAAGKSIRTGGSTKKQFVELCGMPVIARTLTAFEACPEINEIIIVSGEEDFDKYALYKDKYSIKKLSSVVKGGNTRMESVINGFRSISEKTDFVAIHDGARCLITPDDITKVLKAAYKKGAAIAVCPSTDTLKSIDKSGIISSTVDRSTVVRAQTPQVFSKDIFTVAAAVSEKKNISATDDSMLAETAGIPVLTVDIGTYNIKITNDIDFTIAGSIIERRNKE